MNIPKFYKDQISEFSEKNSGECVYKKKNRLERELTLVNKQIKSLESESINRMLYDFKNTPENFTQEEILNYSRQYGLGRMYQQTYVNGPEKLTIGYDRYYDLFKISSDIDLKTFECLSVIGDLFTIISNTTIHTRIVNYADFCDTLKSIKEQLFYGDII